MSAIVLATPHPRNDVLEERLRDRLTKYDIVRVQTAHDLSARELARIDPDYVFFPHWSWLIPESIHTRFECVVFHMTDVPYGRGGSPLQNLIVRGHHETMLSALKCEKALDAGPVYLKQPLALVGTAEDILQRASALMEDMIVEIVEQRPAPVPQQGEEVVFKRRRPSDSDLAPAVNLRQAYDYIRMLDADGYPLAFLETGHLHFEFSEARLGDDAVIAKVRIRKRLDD